MEGQASYGGRFFTLGFVGRLDTISNIAGERHGLHEHL
jgi:hypothetical protein